MAEELDKSPEISQPGTVSRYEDPQDSFTRWEKCYPKETYSSQELHCPQTGNPLNCVTSVTCMFLSGGNTCGPILVLSFTSRKTTRNNICCQYITEKYFQ